MTGWVVFWAGLAVLFTAGEVGTRSWRLWPFAAAAGFAAGGATLGASAGVQWAVYALSAALLPLVVSRLARPAGK